VLPIVGCGAFYPEFDLQGKALQRLGRPSFEFEHVAMNITVYQEQTVAFFCWLGEPDGPAGTFVKSFGSLSHNLLADALVRINFYYAEIHSVLSIIQPSVLKSDNTEYGHE
jgi:hypothetical protein